MTDIDLTVVERYVVELWRPTKKSPRPPVGLCEGRVEIDLSKWPEKCDADILQDRLSQALGRKGYQWDVWFLNGSKDTLIVDEKEDVMKEYREYDVEVSWPVFKTYRVKASDPESAKAQIDKMIDAGEVCVWTDGFETRDGADPTIEVMEIGGES